MQKISLSEHVEQIYEIPALMSKNDMDKFLTGTLKCHDSLCIVILKYYFLNQK